MSSRKMSESGWRPTVAVSRSSEKRLPAFGPRRTTTTPMPVGSSASNAPMSSSSSWRSSMGRVTVVSSSVLARGAPQDEQKLAPASLSCPHRAQITLERVLPPGPFRPGDCDDCWLLLLDEATVGGRVEQGIDLRCVRHLDHEDPPVPVRVLIQLLRGRFQPGVDLGDRPADRCVDVRHRLRRLDLGDAAHGAHVRADIRELYEYNITERVLGEVRDPHPAACAFHRDPLVLFRVPKLIGEIHAPMSTSE